MLISRFNQLVNDGVLALAYDVVAVTPNDTTPIVEGGVALAFRPGTDGDVTFITPGGTTATITCTAGKLETIPVTHIKETGTDVEDILAYV